MTPTYIIQAPAGLGHDADAIHLANALGCIDLIPDWDGAAELDHGVCAFTSHHHTPPFGACVVQIADADDMGRMVRSLMTLEINPPHIDFALRRITLGASSERDARQLAEHIATLRERTFHAECQLSVYEGSDPYIVRADEMSAS